MHHPISQAQRHQAAGRAREVAQMALKDRPRDARKPAIHGAPCSVGELYRTNLADPEELAEIHALLYEDGLNAAEVLDEITKSGYNVARTAINRHRGRTCRCFNLDRDFCRACKRPLAAHGDCADVA